MPDQPASPRRFFHEAAGAPGITAAMLRDFAEKRSAAYGVPNAPTAPKAPSLGSSNVTGAKPVGTYKGVPPITRGIATHKPIANLQSMTTQRSSDLASRGAASKLNGTTGTASE